ncbi:MAG: DUF58 domain-containing protein [Pirellulales bacterium]
MPDSKKYLHPEAVARVARLDLRARYVVEGFFSGLHRSRYFGRSIEFLQHRQYVPGDDPRHVDWKVWARKDRLYVKQYEEDTNLRCTLLVDASRSMHYGSGPLNKFDYACSLAASVAYLSLHQHDSVACTVFDEEVRASLPHRSRFAQLHEIIKAFDVAEPAGKTDMHRILRETAETLPRRGLVVLFSDLLAEREGFFRGIRLLRQRGHDVLVFQILDDDELDFPFTGPVRFDAAESTNHLTCNPRLLKEGYLEALQTFLEEVCRGCAQNRADYQLIRTSDPLDMALTTMLASRAHRGRATA